MARMTAELVATLTDRVSAQARGIERSLDRMEQTGMRSNRALDRGTRSASRMGGALGLVAAQAGAVAAPLAVGFGAKSLITTSADFEASMNRVQAALQSPQGEFEKLSDLAREMGRTTSFRASEAADAIEMLAKNGLSASQILGGALSASMLVAASSGSDLASASDLVTDVMNNFGKEAKDLDGIADKITGTLLQSKFGINDYRLALAQAGGVAGGLGVTIDDFNTTIAGTSSAFASGSDAGTSFKAFLSRLVPASNAAHNAMEKMNLNFFDAHGNMKSMAEISGELQDGVKGLSDEARNDYFQTIFGTDAIRTAIQLSRIGQEGYESLAAKIALGSATEQAEARLKGFWGEIKKLQSASEGVMLDIGLDNLPTDAVIYLRDVVNEIGESLEGFSDNFSTEGFEAAKAAVGELIGRIEQLMGMTTANSSIEAGFRDIANVANQIVTAVDAISTELVKAHAFASDPAGYLADPQRAIEATEYSAMPFVRQPDEYIGPRPPEARSETTVERLGGLMDVRKGSLADTGLGWLDGFSDWANDRHAERKERAPLEREERRAQNRLDAARLRETLGFDNPGAVAGGKASFPPAPIPFREPSVTVPARQLDGERFGNVPEAMPGASDLKASLDALTQALINQSDRVSGAPPPKLQGAASLIAPISTPRPDIAGPVNEEVSRATERARQGGQEIQTALSVRARPVVDTSQLDMLISKVRTARREIAGLQMAANVAGREASSARVDLSGLHANTSRPG